MTLRSERQCPENGPFSLQSVISGGGGDVPEGGQGVTQMRESLA